MMEGVSSTMIYCKKFCKYHNVSPIQNSKTKQNKTKKHKILKKTGQIKVLDII
jgi:hypothetical protein